MNNSNNNKQTIPNINSNKNFNKFFILFIILINCNYIRTQNATTCFEMYSNNSIQQNCFNTSACCYVEYNYYNNTNVKCIVKFNNSEDICPGINDITSKESASLSYCDCFASFFFINFLVIFFVIATVI